MSNLVFLLIFIFWISSIFIVLKFGHNIGPAKICYSPRGKQDRKLRVYISGAMNSDPEHPDHFHRTTLALIADENGIDPGPGSLDYDGREEE